MTRSRHWHNIVKSFGYEIEIMLDGLTWEQAQEKEVEFIALYGRKQKGGILCNLTDGGGGGLGMITSDETKKKQSLKKIGKPPSNKGKPMLPILNTFSSNIQLRTYPDLRAATLYQ